MQQHECVCWTNWSLKLCNSYMNNIRLILCHNLIYICLLVMNGKQYVGSHIHYPHYANWNKCKLVSCYILTKKVLWIIKFAFIFLLMSKWYVIAHKCLVSGVIKTTVINMRLITSLIILICRLTKHLVYYHLSCKQRNP